MGDSLNKQGEWYLRDVVLGYSLASKCMHTSIHRCPPLHTQRRGSVRSVSPDGGGAWL